MRTNLKIAGPKTNIEVSGNELDIIGETKFYARLDVFKEKPKRIVGLVLCGNSVDREVLIGHGVLKQWRLLHETFPHETIDDYCKQYLNDKIQIYKQYPDVNQINSAELKTPLKECKVRY